jgi:hypothetical protein
MTTDSKIEDYSAKELVNYVSKNWVKASKLERVLTKRLETALRLNAELIKECTEEKNNGNDTGGESQGCL